MVAFAGALEAILRTTHWLGARASWSRPDETIGWRFRGNADYWYDSRENDHPITGRTNNYGWNDRQWQRTKAAGTVRVAVLGDSYVEALQVERERNFLSLAGKLLDQDGDGRFELMNFGRSGFTQTEEWLILTREIVQFSPDIVVLLYYAPNDIADVDPHTATDRLRPFPVSVTGEQIVFDTGFNREVIFRVKSLLSPLKNHSALVSLIAEKLALIQALRASASSDDADQRHSPVSAAGIGGYLSLATTTPDALYAKNYAITKALVGAMILFCRHRHIDFLLVAVDTPAYLPQVGRRIKDADPTFRFGFFDHDLADLARESGAQFLGLDARFRRRYAEIGAELHFSAAYPQEPRVLGNLSHRGHWNYAGHRFVAELLAAKLRRMESLRKINPK